METLSLFGPLRPEILSTCRTVEMVDRDYQRFALLFWEFFNQLGDWRDTVDQRLKAIERRLPHS